MRAAHWVALVAILGCGSSSGDGTQEDGGGIEEDGGGTEEDGGGEAVYTGPWETLAAMPDGGAWPAVGVIGSKIHVVPSNATRHLVYDSAGPDEWTEAESLPEAAYYHAGAAVDGLFYVIGGGNPSAMDGVDWNHQYDPATDGWIEKAPMPTGRGYLNSEVVGSEIFAFGGPNVSGETYNRTIEAYDTNTDTWRTGSLMDSSTMWPLYSAVGVDSGRIYKLGGGISNNPFDTAWAYDVGDDEWVQLSDLPEANHGPAGAALDGVVYIMGGYLSDGITDRVWAYDIESDSTTQLDPLPWAVAYSKAVAIDGCLYLVGGHDNANDDASTGFFRWCP